MTHYLRALVARLRGLFGDRRADREFDDEIETHLRLLTERYVRQGMTEDEAIRAARRQFGNVTLLKEVNREMRGIRFIETLFQDARYGLWMMRRNPGFTLVAVLTLALGIGANTAIFSVVNALVFNPLPYPNPQQLMWVTNDFRGNELIGADMYLTYQMQSQTFAHLAAYVTGIGPLPGANEPEQIGQVLVTASAFAALGVAPRLGRAFTTEEDQPGAPPVVVLGYEYWQRRFGGDPAVIGQTLPFGTRKWTVLGVMPPGFRFLPEQRAGGKADVIVPFALDARRQFSGESPMLIEGGVFGRLRSGVSREQAQAELSLLLQRYAQNRPSLPPGLEARVTPLAERLVGHLRRGLLVLFGVVVCVMLIACANVANLLLARAGTRQKEVAIRAALGAGRRRLLRQMLTESLLLAVSGGLAGFWLAWWSVRALVTLAPEDMLQLKVARVDGAALWFTFGATLLTGLLAGLIPAWQAARIEVNESLKDGARGSSFLNRRSARRVSPALVVGELALTFVLLIGAGLLVKSFVRLRAMELGYNPRHLLTMWIPSSGKPSPRYLQELHARLAALPGVRAVSYSRALPLHDNGLIRKRWLAIAGRPLVPDDQQPLAEAHLVSADFFGALEIPLLAGRGFTERDNEQTPPVIVINETFARLHFAGENPVGRRVRVEGRAAEATIIGVAADVKWTGPAAAQAEFFSPLLQHPDGDCWFVALRTAGDPLPMLPSIRQTVTALAPGRRINGALTMEQRLSDSLAPRRLQLLLFSIFADVALLLAAVGVYGVIAYSVSRRTHEIGIRMALGAQARDVLLLVVRQGLALALIGVAVGLAAAFALTRLMTSLLFNVNATDPLTFASISLLLVGVASLASYLPARRATKVDPLQSLRHE